MMKNIVFLGAPAAGKGTQSAFIIRDYGIVQISTGAMLRAEVKEGNELGLLAGEYMSNGSLVPDKIIIDIIRNRLEQPDCRKGFILDGFPRTIAQAEALDSMLHNELGVELTHVISLEISDELIYDRVTGRRSCPECGRVYNITFNPPQKSDVCDFDGAELIQRSDDTKETLTKRLEVYRESTAMLKQLYAKRNKLLIVDATRLPDEVYKEIKGFIE
ncbi:MAG: adenylate kinase [Deferribacteraceae bacterium]|jgi:adenylate kinase|nr:adenylate kinase [Deferribacteraceae bacterium]